MRTPAHILAVAVLALILAAFSARAQNATPNATEGAVQNATPEAAPGSSPARDPQAPPVEMERINEAVMTLNELHTQAAALPGETARSTAVVRCLELLERNLERTANVSLACSSANMLHQQELTPDPYKYILNDAYADIIDRSAQGVAEDLELLRALEPEIQDVPGFDAVLARNIEELDAFRLACEEAHDSLLDTLAGYDLDQGDGPDKIFQEQQLRKKLREKETE